MTTEPDTVAPSKTRSSPAGICRTFGWTRGTVLLRGDVDRPEPEGHRLWQITAVGERQVLGRPLLGSDLTEQALQINVGIWRPVGWPFVQIDGRTGITSQKTPDAVCRLIELAAEVTRALHALATTHVSVPAAAPPPARPKPPQPTRETEW